MLKNIIQKTLLVFYPLFKKLMPYQVYAYLAVGAANTALNIVLFAIGYQVLQSGSNMQVAGISIEAYTVSLLIAFACTVPTGYWLSKNFAFNTQGNGQATTGHIGRYFLVVLQGLLSDYLLLKFLIEIINMHPTVAKVISTMLVLSANYLLQKHFTFKAKTS
jgi:putative flippase GtrA